MASARNSCCQGKAARSHRTPQSPLCRPTSIKQPNTQPSEARRPQPPTSGQTAGAVAPECDRIGVRSLEPSGKAAKLLSRNDLILWHTRCHSCSTYSSSFHPDPAQPTRAAAPGFGQVGNGARYRITSFVPRVPFGGRRACAVEERVRKNDTARAR